MEDVESGEESSVHFPVFPSWVETWSKGGSPQATERGLLTINLLLAKLCIS